MKRLTEHNKFMEHKVKLLMKFHFPSSTVVEDSLKRTIYANNARNQTNFKPLG